MIRLSIVIARVLVYFGADLICLCGHRRSEHDFDEWTPNGCCQHGDYASGCDCMVYEVKGSRPVDRSRGSLTPLQIAALERRN